MTVPAVPDPEEAPDDKALAVDVTPSPPDAQWIVWIAVASVVVAAAPIVSAAVRAINRDWLPIGDNAFFIIRARDVFTDHHPLLGLWTSASLSAETSLNHPGPLFFDLLALPVRMGGGNGLVAGVAAVNVAAVTGIALVARRLGGPRLVVAAMAMAAALAWTMGSELLFDPWQPHSMLLPFLCVLTLVWGISTGDAALLPWAALVASLVMQTHLGYAVLTPALGLWAVAGLAWHVRRASQQQPDRAVAIPSRVKRIGAVTAVVLLVCWSQPLIEQFTGDGKGNLSQIVASAGGSDDSVGPVVGARFVATVAASPPWWGRPSFGRSFLPGPHDPLGADVDHLRAVPSKGAAAVGLVALVTLLGVLLAWTFRRRDRVATMALATGAFALVVAWITASVVPIGPFGAPPHQVRWLWPITIFTTFAIAVGLARALRHRAAWVTAGFAAAALVLAVLNLPRYNQETGPSADEAGIPVVRGLNAQLGPLEAYGTLAFDIEGQRFAEPFSMAVQAELQRRGIPFVVRDEALVRQFGNKRRFDGDADAVVFLREGQAAFDMVPGAIRVAVAEGLPPREGRELETLRMQVGDFVRQNGLPLSDLGQQTAASGDIPWLDAESSDVEALLDDRSIVTAVQLGYLDFDDQWTARFSRYATLQRRWDLFTVGVFVAPMPFGSFTTEGTSAANDG